MKLPASGHFWGERRIGRGGEVGRRSAKGGRAQQGGLSGEGWQDQEGKWRQWERTQRKADGWGAKSPQIIFYFQHNDSHLDPCAIT